MRFLRPAAIVAAVLAGVGVGAWLAGRGGSSPATTPSTAARPAARFDPSGAYLVAGRSGDVLVGLAVRSGGPVEVIAVPPDLHVLPAAAVGARAGGASPKPTSCGVRCYRFALPVLDGRPRRLTVTVRGRPVAFRLPPRLPTSAASVFRTATRRMAALRSVRIDESLSSGRSAIRARFALEAPDRMRYVTTDGGRAVVVGTTRWDFLDRRWQKSPYQRTRQPAYMWEGARYPRLLGRERLGGRRVEVVTVFRPDRDYPAWLRLYVTRQRRIVRAEMIAPAHFMVDRLSAFDRAGPVRRPS